MEEENVETPPPVSELISDMAFAAASRSPSRPPFKKPAKSQLKTPDKTLRDLNGIWILSKSLSTGVPMALEIQGFNSPARRAIISAPIKISIMQSNYPSQIFIKQQPTTSSNTLAANVPPITERWYPSQKTGAWSDWVSDHSFVLGETRSRSRWVRGTDFEHKEGIGYLTEGLGRLAEYFEAEVECPGNRWRSGQVWFVERGRLVRRVVTVGREGRRAETRFVYEFEGR